jgi:hypothetical protein
MNSLWLIVEVLIFGIISFLLGCVFGYNYKKLNKLTQKKEPTYDYTENTSSEWPIPIYVRLPDDKDFSLTTNNRLPWHKRLIIWLKNQVK